MSKYARIKCKISHKCKIFRTWSLWFWKIYFCENCLSLSSLATFVWTWVQFI